MKEPIALTFLAFLTLTISLGKTFYSQGSRQEENLRAIIIHPVHAVEFKSTNHYAGQYKGDLGDELGKNVLIAV